MAARARLLFGRFGRRRSLPPVPTGRPPGRRWDSAPPDRAGKVPSARETATATTARDVLTGKRAPPWPPWPRWCAPRGRRRRILSWRRPPATIGGEAASRRHRVLPAPPGALRPHWSPAPPAPAPEAPPRPAAGWDAAPEAPVPAKSAQSHRRPAPPKAAPGGRGLSPPRPAASRGWRRGSPGQSSKRPHRATWPPYKSLLLAKNENAGG